MFMPSDWHEVNVGGAQLQTHDCAIKLRACFLPMKSSTVDLVNIWGPGYCLSACWSLISYLNVDPSPPYIHFLSTRHHSRDRCSQAFSVFHHSTTSVILNTNRRTKSGGRPGNEAGKTEGHRHRKHFHFGGAECNIHCDMAICAACMNINKVSKVKYWEGPGLPCPPFLRLWRLLQGRCC